jgi:Arc/MetJ-type ribon-helix-helix transcriptional regulator
MKISVSLSSSDARFLDEYVAKTGAPSRSDAVRRALDLLRTIDMEAAYTSAWREWESSDDAQLWDATSADA